MIKELIGRVMQARNSAHLEHWSTGSYAAHQALGEFYEGVIPKLDTLVEAYQGAFGKVGRVDLLPPASQKCSLLLGEQVLWMGKNRDSICKDIEALENVLDEIVSLYLKTLYKLKELS